MANDIDSRFGFRFGTVDQLKRQAYSALIGLSHASAPVAACEPIQDFAHFFVHWSHQFQISACYANQISVGSSVTWFRICSTYFPG
jgi:hypothetical protein